MILLSLIQCLFCLCCAFQELQVSECFIKKSKISALQINEPDLVCILKPSCPQVSYACFPKVAVPFIFLPTESCEIRKMVLFSTEQADLDSSRGVGLCHN